MKRDKKGLLKFVLNVKKIGTIGFFEAGGGFVFVLPDMAAAQAEVFH